LRSANPRYLPIIERSCRERDEDVEVLVKGLELTRELVHISPLDAFRQGDKPLAVPGKDQTPLPRTWCRKSGPLLLRPILPEANLALTPHDRWNSVVHSISFSY
jgi:hypothetical protein